MKTIINDRCSILVTGFIVTDFHILQKDKTYIMVKFCKLFTTYSFHKVSTETKLLLFKYLKNKLIKYNFMNLFA